MTSEKDKVIDNLKFEDEKEYLQAMKELETIRNLENKMYLGDPKAALQLYNSAVSKKTFKTVIGYRFLLRLRDTIVSCGLVSDSALNPVPVVVSKKGIDRKSAKDDLNADIYRGLYQEEKKKKKLLYVLIVTLIVAIIGMFLVTINSKYSFITYFTDYENEIREDVINEYEEWEKSLNEREAALNNPAE